MPRSVLVYDFPVEFEAASYVLHTSFIDRLSLPVLHSFGLAVDEILNRVREER